MQGKRYALPNTRIMLHHPSGSARGQALDIHNEARELMRLRNYVNQVLSQATGQPIERVRIFPNFVSVHAATWVHVQRG
jgi:ATP-dependent Clp protease protease subunit